MKKLSVLLAAATLGAGSLLAASSLDFRVNLSGVATGGAAPYALNFQLTQGDSRFDLTTVTLSNFSFVGGSASGAADFSASTGTGASGSTGSGFTLNVGGSNSYSDILQGFTNGTSLIGFDVHVVTDVGSGLTPDSLYVVLLDSGFTPLATNAPGSSNYYLKLDINNGFTLGDIATASGSGVSASVSAVPEPSTYGLMGAGAAAAVAFVRRRRKLAGAIAA